MRNLILAVFGLVFAGAACSKDTSAPPAGAAYVALVSVTLPSPTVVVGETEHGVATAKDVTGTPLSGRLMIWRSSVPAVASVNDAGMISALAPGATMISASAEGVSGSASLTVNAPAPVPVASVSVSLSASSVVVGQSAQATATVKDASGNTLSGRVVTWESSNNGIATVSPTGGVIAVAAGSATLTATSEGVNGSATLTVTTAAPVPVATVSVSLNPSSVVAGQTGQATATLKDAGGNTLSGRVVTWQSSSQGVATISSSGGISAIAAGTTTITATSEGKSGTATLTVTAASPVPVATVTVSLSASSLVAGQPGQATATLKDASGNTLSGRVVTWQSSSQGVATISSSGGISAIAAGTTTITATSEGKTGTATLTVTAAPVASVTVSPTTASVQVGGTQQYTAVTRDASGNILTGRTITWTSNATGIATVSASGLGTGVATGSATITATSGTASGTANITVTTSQLSTPVFSDDFESGTMSKWSESDASVQQVINDPALAHSGNRFLRLTYGINGGDAGWLNKYFTQGFNQVYVRYYVRFSNNFTGGTKLVGFHGAPIGNPSFGMGRAGICPNGTDSFAGLVVTVLGGGGGTFPTKMYTYWQDMWADSDGKCWGRYGPTPSTFPYISPMPEFTRGVWHKVEYTIKMNSSATVADGEQRFWVDGVKYGEWKGIRFGDPTRINIGVLLISGSGDTGQIQTLDYDDLILTTDYPAQSQP